MFSHPSYSEAIKHLLVEDRQLTRINKDTFSRLLLKLSEKDSAPMDRLSEPNTENFSTRVFKSDLE